MRKIFKSGNSLVVSLPKDSLEAIGLQEGSEVSIVVDRERGRIVIDSTFAQQLNDFIEQYRPALEALAK